MKTNINSWHPDIPLEYRNQIVTGDARELAKRIPDESIDLIFTDPPYAKEFFPLYFWLGYTAARILKPTGFLITYVPPFYKNKHMTMFDGFLEYFWDYIEVNKGNSTIIWPRKTIAKYKSLLCYHRKGFEPLPVTNVLGVWNGYGSDKRYHKWGQTEDTAKYYIDVFTNTGAVVLDPFCGGGTVPFVCKIIHNNFIGFEIDQDYVDIAKKRLEKIEHQLEMYSMSDLPPCPEQKELF